MARKYFGTDGIRGRANKSPIRPDLILKIGMAIGVKFSKNNSSKRIVIAKDTRLSGYMIESSLTSALSAVGIDVFLVGPVPTPAVAMLTKSLRANAGIMISAILRLTQAEWRRPVTRAAELLTVFSLLTALFFPLMHAGRPWRIAYWLLPYDFARGIWPNVRSPLFWDPIAIGTYLTGSTLFLFVALKHLLKLNQEGLHHQY